MSNAPQWSTVDDSTADLLTLVADTDHPSVDLEWQLFVDAIDTVANWWDGSVDQNHMRPIIRGEIAPKRIGSFYRRACAEGLLEVDGWSISEDHAGRNAGRPMRKYRRP